MTDSKLDRAGRARRNIQIILDIAKVGPTRFAELAGVGRTYLDDFLKERTQSIVGKSVELARAFNLNPDFLTGERLIEERDLPRVQEAVLRGIAQRTAEPLSIAKGVGAGGAPSPNLPNEIALPDRPVQFPPFQEMPKDIPVRGLGYGGEKGDFTFNGEEVDYVRRPPALAQQRGVFGLYIANDSMVPRYKPGELILASSGKRPRVGDCVVVEMKPTADEMAGVGYVKEFVRQTATQTVVQQFNPPKELIFDNREIKQIYKVLDYEDLIGL